MNKQREKLIVKFPCMTLRRNNKPIDTEAASKSDEFVEGRVLRKRNTDDAAISDTSSRSARYYQKLKTDQPDKYSDLRLKDAKRKREGYYKANELSVTAHRLQREKWRASKMKQRGNKEQTTITRNCKNTEESG